MKLDLKPLMAGEAEKLDFSCRLDLSYVKLWGENPLVKPVTVTGSVEDGIRQMTLQYRIEAVLSARCGRCLQPVEVAESYHFSHPVLLRPSENEDDLVCDRSGMLELDELFVSDLLPELPFSVVCREDCPGLCPVCGANLTDGDCGCPKNSPDPRFDVLRKLMEE